MFLLEVDCGGLFTIDEMIPDLISMAINIIKVVVPVLLVIFGMIDLGKAVVAQKEDEIKKGQATFFKRLLAAAIVFFVIMVVQIILGIIAPANRDKNESIISCFNCLINGSSKCD